MSRNSILRRCLGALLVALSFTVNTSHAENKRVITAGITPTAPPIGYKDPNTGELVGVDKDLFEAIAAKMGVTVNWSDMGWEQLMPAITTKRIDVIVSGMQDTPERRGTVNFVNYLSDGVQLITLRSNASRFPDLNAVCGKKVGATRSGIMGPLLEKWSAENCTARGKPAVVIVPTDSTADSRLQLKQGRADAATIARNAFAFQNKLEGDIYQAVGKPYATQLLGIGFSKDNPELGISIKAGIASIMADGTYAEILNKWGLAESALDQPLINGAP